MNPAPHDRSSGTAVRTLAGWLTGVWAALLLPAAPMAQAQEPAEPVQAQESAEPVVDPPGRVARLGYAEGEVTVAPAGTEEWAEATLNRPLTSGDRVWVDGDGRAELQIGSTVTYLDRSTGVGFIELDDDVVQMSLTEGAATIRVRRLAEGETIQVETPHSTVYLRRVGEYHLEVDKAGERTIVKARSGEAEVRGGSKQYTVRANEQGIFSGAEQLTADIGSLPPRTGFESWANERDQRAEQSKSARYVSRDVIGYEDLDDNGDWLYERDYGYVWRPRYVAYDWAPYRYGRWVWVSPWGWSWVDDARWGFAPSHYGRWAYLRGHRWCWVPGPRHLRPVYAPALVGWVGGSGVSLSVSFGSGIGWFPLGPHEVFYPGYRHTPRYNRYVNISNTIIINNNYFYGRGSRPIYDHRRHPHAVTVVSRDHFVAGRSLGGQRLRLSDADLRGWRSDSRPPAIAPYRESVLAGQQRRGPRDGERWHRDFTAGRVPFHTERSAIEANGGRPIGRSQLRDRNPKELGDFRSVRQGLVSGDTKRAERERADRTVVREGDWQGNPARDRTVVREGDWQGNPARDRTVVREGDWRGNPAGDRFARERGGMSLDENRNSFRERSGSDRSDNRQRGSSPVTNGSRERVERVESMRADERPQEVRRRDHLQRPPANGFQRDGQSSSQRERRSNESQDIRRRDHMERPPMNSFQQDSSSSRQFRERRDSGSSPVIRESRRESWSGQRESRSRPEIVSSPRPQQRAPESRNHMERSAPRQSHQSGNSGRSEQRSRGNSNSGGSRPLTRER